MKNFVLFGQSSINGFLSKTERIVMNIPSAKDRKVDYGSTGTRGTKLSFSGFLYISFIAYSKINKCNP